MAKKVKAREDNLQKVEAKHGKDSPAYELAKAQLAYARKEWHATPKGLQYLEMRADQFVNDFTKADLLKARQARAMQENAATEIESGRVAAYTTLFEDQTGFYNQQEVASVIESAREYQEYFAARDGVELASQPEEEYKEFVDNIEQRLQNRGKLTAEKQAALAALRELPAPDQINAAAYAYIPTAMARSKRALRDELGRVAAIQGVPQTVASAYYEAYREQYTRLYANVDETLRPDPPKDWVRGEGPQAGYAKDLNTSFAPRDAASMYAIYRLRSDEDAIPQHFKAERMIASIDLETAGPEGKAGFDPQNGHIIEVGIITLTAKGKEVSRYSQLIRPEQKFLDLHGTGSEDVHHISVNDLKGKPDWKAVQGRVAKQLEGKVLLAQNASFEQKWLSHHLSGFAANKSLAVIDTRDLAQKHLDLPNYRLQTVCESLGIEYTNGHRATHDAEVAGAAYATLRRYIKKTWNSKEARRTAPLLKEEPMGSRWDTYRPTFVPKYFGSKKPTAA